ncbi:esterase FE4-like [Bacillus rossius redtenbacheri]|uniref:esterase FE4-like n=1 Tax=Bacillus rossius redtenbacheri TaxID=93214 RepID=UPI002FDE9618
MKVCAAAAVVLAAWLAAAAAGAAGQEPLVRVSEGLVRGTTLSTRLNATVYSFLGVPYARPPVGDLRFRDPVAAESWDGVLDASRDREVCAQRTHPERKIVGHEDCLHLNVYTTRLLNDSDKSAELWDVVVLLHAGGFSHGSANSVDYCPDNLLDNPVVLVAPNYRLGAFGFLSTGDGEAAGNYGLKDQLLALRWVRRNVAAFGGDPGRVTLLGAQAGAASAHLHMLSPRSQGLLHGAVSQSGTALLPWALVPLDVARERALRLAELVGCRKRDLETSRALLQCLRRKPADEISRHSAGTMDRVSEMVYPFVPVVDRDFLPAHPARLMQEPGAGVPWMVGVASHEGLPLALQAMVFPALKDGLNDETEKFLVKFVGLDTVRPATTASSIASQLWQFYMGNDTLEYSTITQLAQIISDYHYFHGVLRSVRTQSAARAAPIFVYEFAYNSRDNVMALGVPQGDDTEFLFPNIIAEVKLVLKEKDVPLFNRLVRLVLNFAKHGNPTPGQSVELGNLTWPPATPDNFRFLRIAKELTVETQFYPKRMAFWDNIQQQLSTPASQVKDEL